MATINNALGNRVGGSNSGATNTFTITNPSNTASSQANEVISVGGSSAGDPFTTYTVSGTTNWSHGIDNSVTGDPYVIAASAALGTTNVMVATTAGEITKPLQPAFLAYVSNTIANVTGDGTVYTVIFSAEAYDQSNDFDLATGTFTAPVTGKYHFCFNCVIVGGTLITESVIRIVSSNLTYESVGSATSNEAGTAVMSMSLTLDMDAADTVTFTVTTTDTGGKIDDIQAAIGAKPRTWASGELIL